MHEPNAQEQAVLEQALGIKLRLPNFKHMPELGWAWGYAWALALMAVSALLTYVIVSVRTALTAPCFAVPIHIECSAARGYRGSPGRG